MKKTKEGMNYEIYYRPGLGEKGRDFLAVTPDCIGGMAFGKTEKSALGALKRVYRKKVSKKTKHI